MSKEDISIITESICRLCGLCSFSKSELHSIFDTTGVSINDTPLIDKITICLPVRITEEDPITKKVCTSCRFKVEDFYEFWNNAALSQEIIANQGKRIGIFENVFKNSTSNLTSNDTNWIPESNQYRNELRKSREQGKIVPIDVAVQTDPLIFLFKPNNIENNQQVKPLLNCVNNPVTPQVNNNLQTITQINSGLPLILNSPIIKPIINLQQPIVPNNQQIAPVNKQKVTPINNLQLNQIKLHSPQVNVPTGTSINNNIKQSDLMSKNSVNTTQLITIPLLKPLENHSSFKNLKPVDISSSLCPTKEVSSNKNTIIDLKTTQSVPVLKLKIDNPLTVQHLKSGQQTVDLKLNANQQNVIGLKSNQQNAFGLKTNQNQQSVLGLKTNHNQQNVLGLPTNQQTMLGLQTNNQQTVLGILYRPSGVTVNNAFKRPQNVGQLNPGTLKFPPLNPGKNIYPNDDDTLPKNWCKLCSRDLQSNYRLQEHLRRHAGIKPYTCKALNCNKKFSTVYTFRAHVLNRHVENGRKNTCIYCARGFITPKLLRDHIKKHLRMKTYKCKHCDFSTFSKSSLETHKRRHTGNYVALCQCCGKGFYTQGSYTHHLLSHTGSVVCKNCNESFESQLKLKYHMNRAHNSNIIPVTCFHCGREFAEKNKIRLHIKRMHFNTGYECYECGLIVSSKSSMIIHARQHTGEKPFKCRICKKRFVSRNVLKIHTVVHTKEKNYKCNLCDKKYSQKSSLNSHKKKVHLNNLSDDVSIFCEVNIDSTSDKLQNNDHSNNTDDIMTISENETVLFEQLVESDHSNASLI